MLVLDKASKIITVSDIKLGIMPTFAFKALFCIKHLKFICLEWKKEINDEDEKNSDVCHEKLLLGMNIFFCKNISFRYKNKQKHNIIISGSVTNAFLLSMMPYLPICTVHILYLNAKIFFEEHLFKPILNSNCKV